MESEHVYFGNRMFTAKDLIGMYAKTIECLVLLVIFYLIMLLPVSVLGLVVGVLMTSNDNSMNKENSYGKERKQI